MNPISLQFELKGFGNVPGGFKNRKRFGKGRVFSDPKVKAWMDQASNVIESTFLSLCPTIDGAIQPECLKQLLNAWPGLSDDSIREFPEGSWSSVRVPHGSEGVTITIEKIP